ncbi:single-stranded DNA-binding protein [Mycoplasma tauri]|uniref:single-stranded DNA-binding protein n=1 Tax=Mycoplasma tauri TaxID=547987 RepID=UPI001CBED1D4|nr:single-stranded DNA-binding protein [Mycoplasma tauri]MBZ4203694.1 single-stranded DNA-binding protein [Mycoplasma tauri]MBZ4227046.1 single-stranded DNA-binding protein [Mycoplasma tauri]
MNLNKVIIIGRIASDVKYSKTNNGTSVARTRIAVSRNYNNDSEATDFIPVVAWRNTADFLNNYAPKGSLVAIEGGITTSTFTNNGQNVFVVEVRVDNLHLLEPRSIREQRQASDYSVEKQNFSFQNKSNDASKFSGFTSEEYKESESNLSMNFDFGDLDE